MSMIISYKKQFLVLIVFFLIMLIPIEAGARIYEHFNPICYLLEKDAFDVMDSELVKKMCRDFNQVQFDKTQAIQMIKPNQHYETININEYGFRGPEIDKEKQNDLFRIFVVGGSTTFGVSSSDSKTISGYLQHKFEEISKMNIEVINAGIPGAQSAREKYLIENMLTEFQPDLIIIYDGGNDARYRPVNFSINENSKRNDSNQNVFTFEQLIDIMRPYRTPFVVNSLLEQLENQTEFEQDKCFGKDRKCPPTDNATITKTAELWKNNIEDICLQGNKEKFATIIALQPIVGTGNKTLSPDEYRFQPHTEHGFATMKTMEQMSLALNDLNRYCTLTIDLRDTFDEISEPVFFDDIHNTDFGNEIIAKKIFEEALPIIEEIKAKEF